MAGIILKRPTDETLAPIMKSLIGTEGASKPLPFTDNPIVLLWNDILLFLRITITWPLTAGIPSIILPIRPLRSSRLCELYPSPSNLYAITLHGFMIVAQLGFMLSLIPSAIIGVPIPFYTPIYLGSIVAFIAVNFWFSILLNGNANRKFYAGKEFEGNPEHAGEKWLFLNGVAVGKHWMQSNLDRLAKTFKRPVTGIHNQTRGIIFDVIECMIQRCFGYATLDIRTAYEELASLLSTTGVKKVVLILHSQGAIEGGMVLDWLYATLPVAQVSKLEIYTFGNAANHWNSPIVSDFNSGGNRRDLPTKPEDRVVKHIEHYANVGDYVSKFGILHFRPEVSVQFQGEDEMTNSAIERVQMEQQEQHLQFQNRFVGRLFKREGSGHQLNGNYLDNIFQMDEDLTTVLEDNEFMSSFIDENLLQEGDMVVAATAETTGDGEDAKKPQVRRIKDVSRLWLYRNGRTPPEPSASS